MASYIARRKFLATLGGAAVAWPLAARAQRTKIARLGFVSWQAPTRAEDLRQGLRELGYVEGKNIEIEVHFVDGDLERTKSVIRTLTQKGVDILVVRATPTAHIAKEMTRTIPIVMQVSDPLATGLVESLSHPGGNLTGVSNSGPDLAGKRLEILREIRPVARETQAAADQIGLNVLVRLVDSADALDESDFQAMQRHGVEAVIVQPIFTGHRVKIVGLARNSQLPVISDYIPFAEAAALLTFGVDDAERVRRVAYYVDRILKGMKPADLPVERPTTFQLVLNVLTAKAFGWTIPPVLLARADKVFE
jgi:putative tryptophan/tyrosine transport system substrate-binding protein